MRFLARTILIAAMPWLALVGARADRRRLLQVASHHHAGRQRRRRRLRRLCPRLRAPLDRSHSGPSEYHRQEPAGGGRACRRKHALQQRRARRLGDRRLHQWRGDGPAVRQSGRALRRAAVQLARQHRQARERLRHLAHQPGQEHCRCARPRSDRGGGRRHVEFRDRAQIAQCPDRHALQGGVRL